MLVKLSFLLVGVVSIVFSSSTLKDSKSTKAKSAILVDLSGQNLNRIPIDVYANSELRVLRLSKNNVVKVDARLQKMHHLAELDLSENSDLNMEVLLEHAPDSSLATLKLRSCGLGLLPLGMERFQRLKSLDLSDNYISMLPSDMEALAKLEYIDLRNNNLLELDFCPYAWWNLREIDVRGNKELHHVPFITALSFLDKLEVIRLDNLSDPGEDFEQLSCKRLEIYDSPQLNFKGTLALNQSIQELVLVNSLRSRARRVLQEVNACMNLRTVKIQDSWKKLPKAIQELNTVSDLDLSGNNLSDVTALHELKGLKRLNLSSNPLSDDADC